MKKVEIQDVARNGLFRGQPLGAVVEETHISWILLTKEFAFKVKKPVSFSFLDFSTLALRKEFCEKELELNRRFSSIYLDVLPLRNENGTWLVGGPPSGIVDYVVRMKRLNSGSRMDLLLKQHKVMPDDVRNLAREVIRIHREALPVHNETSKRQLVDSFNDIIQIEAVVDGAARVLIDEGIEYNERTVASLISRIDERIGLGWKRDLHGDLHSGNIFMGNPPLIFDGIEFNASMRYLDVLDEVAFLCMDLEFFDEHVLASIFNREYQNAMKSITTETDWRIFDYFKCYRANVRAKVHALRASQSHTDSTRHDEMATAHKYLRLMQRYVQKEI